jgi:endoglucanase
MKAVFYKSILLLLFVFIYENSNSQSLFKTNDRVCFVGNSITNNGEFHHNILLYHLTRFPGENVGFYNCGISGNRTGDVLARMEKDILINNPTHAILMIGMNDVSRTLYTRIPTTNADTLKLQKEAIELYKKNLEQIVKQFLELKIHVTLQKPSIYDQTAKIDLPANVGVNDALKTCADFMETLAQKYKLQTVDYWTIMYSINQEQQKVNPAFTLTSKDRVHPEAMGHFVMFYQFLKDKKAPQSVSKIAISKGKKNSKLSMNCEIQFVEKIPSGMKFKVLERSLPFPTVSNQQKALELVPFTADFNQQILQVDGLRIGKYEFSIDDKVIATFTSEQLKLGVNLSDLQTTPQYLQALKVRKILVELWAYESKLRGIKFIEYNPNFKSIRSTDAVSKQKQELDSIFTVKYPSNLNYYLLKSKEYFENKAQENEFKVKSDSLRHVAYNLAQPVIHTFKVLQIKGV